MNIASDGSKCNKKYLFVTEEVKKIAHKLEEMTLIEEKEKEGNSEVNEDALVCTVESEYSQLNDPNVVKSKGRPTVGKQKVDGRYKTIGEQGFSKQQITCSHCGSHDHNIQTCDNLHLDSSNFPRKKKSRKKSSGNLLNLILLLPKIKVLIYYHMQPKILILIICS